MKSLYTTDELIAGIRNRDRKVLMFIYREYYPLINRLISKNSGGEEDAKDIFQEAMVILFEKAVNEQLNIKSSFKSYFYALCKNQWLMVLRKNKNITLIYDSSEELSVDQNEIEAAITQHQQYKLFRNHLKNLGDDCKKILELFWRGNSLRKIAVTMGFTEKYAKKRKFLCQKTLIEAIESDPAYSKKVKS